MKGSAEHNFHNWLGGYMVYMIVLVIAFLEMAWHLMNYFSNVLKARAIIGGGPATEYN